MRALQYFFNEAAESLWRSRRVGVARDADHCRRALRARLLPRWSTPTSSASSGAGAKPAELSVYLQRRRHARAGAGDADADRPERPRRRPCSIVSKDEALTRFSERLSRSRAARPNALERNPFPASFEVRLNPKAQATPSATVGARLAALTASSRASPTCATTAAGWPAELARSGSCAPSGWSSSRCWRSPRR